MANFAVINNNIVENLIVAENLQIAQEITQKTCVEYTNEEVHIGFFYDEKTQKIILEKKPYESWILNNGTWISPVDKPLDGKNYVWNEDLKNWEEKIPQNGWIWNPKINRYIAPIEYPKDGNDYHWNNESLSLDKKEKELFLQDIIEYGKSQDFTGLQEIQIIEGDFNHKLIINGTQGIINITPDTSYPAYLKEN